MAFTLVELLFCVALVAVLAVLSLGVFPKVLERARATRCVGNLRNLGQLGLVYAGEHNGWVLNSFNPTWYVTLGLNKTDLPGREAYHCRSNPLRPMPGTTGPDGKYGLNYGYAYGLWDTTRQLDSFKISKITKPGLKAMFSDGVVSSGNVAWYSIRSDDIAALPKTNERYFHDGAIHIAFYDGSVRRVEMKDVDYRWWGLGYQ